MLVLFLCLASTSRAQENFPLNMSMDLTHKVQAGFKEYFIPQAACKHGDDIYLGGTVVIKGFSKAAISILHPDGTQFFVWCNGVFLNTTLKLNKIETVDIEKIQVSEKGDVLLTGQKFAFYYQKSNNHFFNTQYFTPVIRSSGFTKNGNPYLVLNGAVSPTDVEIRNQNTFSIMPVSNSGSIVSLEYAPDASHVDKNGNLWIIGGKAINVFELDDASNPKNYTAKRIARQQIQKISGSYGIEESNGSLNLYTNLEDTKMWGILTANYAPNATGSYIQAVSYKSLNKYGHTERLPIVGSFNKGGVLIARALPETAPLNYVSFKYVKNGANYDTATEKKLKNLVERPLKKDEFEMYVQLAFIKKTATEYLSVCMYEVANAVTDEYTFRVVVVVPVKIL